MIPKISASEIYSVLGNNSSLIPLGIKDIVNSCGLTAASYVTGKEDEGKDRFIDEFGTQAIWLWGIPAYKKAIDLSAFKIFNFDPQIDVRMLKDSKIVELAQKYAPTKEIKAGIKKAAANSKVFKSLAMGKFVVSTALTALTYFGLTKFRHKYTEKNLIKNYYQKKEETRNKMFEGASNQIPFSSSSVQAFSKVHNFNKNKSKNDKVSFTGGLQNFMFDPVKNLMLVDGTITTERLSHSRNFQDFLGYVIKEGSFWMFMYGAGPFIAKALEKHSEKYFNKSIDLDARVIESKELKNAFKDGSLKTHIESFMKADLSDADIYKFAVAGKEDNLVIEMAKKSDIIPLYKKTKAVDTRKYLDLEELRNINKKLEKLYNQFISSGEDLDTFFKSVRKLKRMSILKNMGSCIAALGIIAPAIMVLVRKFNPEYQVKKDIEEKLENGEITYQA